MGRSAIGVAILSALLACATLSSAATIIIRPDGTGDVPTIAAGLTAAGVGDTLLLAKGTFTGAGNRDLAIPDKNLVIRSRAVDPALCVIDCEGAPGLRLNRGRVTVRGITITGASGYAYSMSNYDYGVQAAATITNCTFSQSGGGIYIHLNWGSATIADCQFISNTAYRGGAVYIYGIALSVTIDGCTFSYNSADRGGAIYCDAHEADAYIRNSVFDHNSAELGGGIVVDNMYTEITNCTLFANHAEYGSGISAYTGERVRRCIVAYGTGGCGFDHAEDPDVYPDVGCTDIYGNDGGDWVGAIAGELGRSGNFSACPGFCNYEIEPYDLHVCLGSPCLPGNHPAGANCSLIGALSQAICGCGPSGTEPTTWGAIKAMYK